MNTNSCIEITTICKITPDIRPVCVKVSHPRQWETERRCRFYGSVGLPPYWCFTHSLHSVESTLRDGPHGETRRPFTACRSRFTLVTLRW